MTGYDLTFDADGRAITDLGSANDNIWQLLPAANGKILAAGINASSNIIITQYNPDGSLDTLFGVGGKLDTGLKGFASLGGFGSISRLSNEDILVAGVDANGISVVASFNGIFTGTVPPTSFTGSFKYSTQNSDPIVSLGLNGRLFFTQENFTGDNKYYNFVALNDQGRGQIIPLPFNSNSSATPQKLDLNILNNAISSAVLNTTDPNVQNVLRILGEPLVNNLRLKYAASRFTLSGLTVGTLNDRGTTINFFGYQDPVAASGYVAFESRFKTDGTFDVSYGCSGLATLSYPANYRGVGDFTIDKVDRIVLAVYNSASDEVTVYRLNASGQIDSAFGTNGQLTLSGAGGADSIDVEIDSQNRVLISTKKTTESLFSVSRVNSNGTLDTTFGTSGKLQLPAVANTLLSHSAVKLGTDDRLFVGGATNGDILVAKYDIGGGVPPATTYAATVYDLNDGDRLGDGYVQNGNRNAEGNSGGTPIVFRIIRSGNTSSATSIDFALAGTATNITDYNIDTLGGGIHSDSGTVNFAANETSKDLRINVLGDILVEPDETIVFTLSNPSATTQVSSIVRATAATTIQNDDGIIQVPTITGAIYINEGFGGKSGELAVVGTGFVPSLGNSEYFDLSKLSIIGEGGKTYTLTSDNVFVPSATNFNIRLNAADTVAISSLLNNNGNYSIGGTKYNLAAAEDWAAGADPALVVADLTDNGITALLGFRLVNKKIDPLILLD
jgi:uncharacterized delta-60 repeat protein